MINILMSFDFLYNMVLLDATAPGDLPDDERNRAERVGTYYENLFAAIATQNGYKCEKSTGDEDRKQHFDFRLFELKNGTKRFAWTEREENKNVPYGYRNCVEVKNEKDAHDSNFKLLEFIGGAGFPGWMYGDANYIAFFNRNTQGFDMVQREPLKEEVEILGKFTFHPLRQELVYTSKTPAQPVKKSNERLDAHLIPHREAIFRDRDSRTREYVLYVPVDIVMKHKKFEINPVRTRR